MPSAAALTVTVVTDRLRIRYEIHHSSYSNQRHILRKGDFTPSPARSHASLATRPSLASLGITEASTGARVRGPCPSLQNESADWWSWTWSVIIVIVLVNWHCIALARLSTAQIHVVMQTLTGRAVRTAPLFLTRPRACVLGARCAHESRGWSAASAARLAARSAAMFAAASAGASLGVLGLVTFLRSEPAPTSPTDGDLLVLQSYAQLPWRTLSRGVGWLHDLQLPLWARAPVLRAYAFALGIQFADAAPAELRAYASAGDLFARRLAPGSRAVDRTAPLVSPVDGVVISAGPVSGSPRPCMLVKGVPYSLSTLLGGGSAHQDRPLHQVTIYLAPSDYHGFHAPADAVVAQARHVAGSLLSVHPSLLSRLPVLSSNERVVLSGVWRHGYLALVAVGATGVGSIELEHDPSLRTNERGSVSGTVAARELPLGQGTVARGQRLGGFRIGSSVVLIFESAGEPAYAVAPGQRVRLGEPLVRSLRPPAHGQGGEAEGAEPGPTTGGHVPGAIVPALLGRTRGGSGGTRAEARR